MAKTTVGQLVFCAGVEYTQNLTSNMNVGYILHLSPVVGIRPVWGRKYSSRIELKFWFHFGLKKGTKCFSAKSRILVLFQLSNRYSESPEMPNFLTCYKLGFELPESKFSADTFVWVRIWPVAQPLAHHPCSHESHVCCNFCVNLTQNRKFHRSYMDTVPVQVLRFTYLANFISFPNSSFTDSDQITKFQLRHRKKKSSTIFKIGFGIF